MKSISIQFHATTEEIFNFVASVSSELGLIITMMILKPFNLERVEGEFSLCNLNAKLEEGDLRLVLNTNSPCLESKSPNSFLDENPGSIVIDIGSLSSLGLQESALSFISDEKAKISVANKVASRLKNITKTGAVAVNPVNGAEAKIRSHRFTEGAKLKYDEGIKILPVAGNSLYKLSD
ncbi:hypothetical protein [Pseudoalteromonas luteoviolacea]|uniref:Uncharacterized protein n=1 Tax=Pseudoalteromonas luteoviolacea S4060-1 TaxID=1365257 RepID=A0A167MGX2_9GAMM|nr:hypothetical protein [Pseudoalteromonas luteoviolacea]KZN66403.1 hypothetical protein N478_20270 [Pseudoalteromonas luteoviolacea S4060-1]